MFEILAVFLICKKYMLELLMSQRTHQCTFIVYSELNYRLCIVYNVCRSQLDTLGFGSPVRMLEWVNKKVRSSLKQSLCKRQIFLRDDEASHESSC